jgi:hypothetical protein
VLIAAVALALLLITRPSARDEGTQQESESYAAEVASDEQLVSEEPSEAMLAQVDRAVDNMLDDLDPQRAVSERERQERKKAETETVEQTVRNLLEKAHVPVGVIQGDAFLKEIIARLPRVRRLLLIAARDEAQKEKVLQYVTEMCREYVEELPDFTPDGQEWAPTAMSPHGGMAYAYLLSELDDNAFTLPLVVRMHLRQQSAGIKYFESQFGPYGDTSKWAICDHGMILAYACDHFLDLYCSREDLWRTATPAQRQVLERFKVYVEDRSERKRGWSWYGDQLKILRFATDFVQRGRSEEPGEAMPDDSDPLRQRARQQTMEAETETVQQTARNVFALESSLLFAPPFEHPQAFLENIRKLPRVRRLLLIAARDEAEKEQVLQYVTEMCREYVEEVPDFHPPDEAWVPEANYPGGGMAYAYLLAELDDNAATLDLVVRMHLRQQSAIRKHSPGVYDPSKLIRCDHGVTLAYACDRFLSLYCSREDLRHNVTPEQIEVLERFSKYQEGRSQTQWDYYSDQRKILGFATNFVQKGGVEGEE